MQAFAQRRQLEATDKALALKQKAKTPKTPAKAKGPAKGVRGKGRVLVENHVPGSVRGSVRKQVESSFFGPTP